MASAYAVASQPINYETKQLSQVRSIELVSPCTESTSCGRAETMHSKSLWAA